MENASKALLMAAGTLIGMLIISLAVYLFTSFGSRADQIRKDNAKLQIDQFNTQFTSYVGKEGNTIYDVVTAANLATQNNIYYEFVKRNTVAKGQDNYISVEFKNSDISKYNNQTIERGFNENMRNVTNNYNELIQADLAKMQDDLTRYDCKVEISPTTRKSV